MENSNPAPSPTASARPSDMLYDRVGMQCSLTGSTLWSVLACLLVAASPLAAGPPNRIHADLQNRQTFGLTGNIHPRLASAADQGEVEGSFPLPWIAMHFKMTAAQQADLDSLLKAQQDRSSPQYHKWLTPEQYAARFGLSEGDLAKVTTWLERMGFTNIQLARGGSFVSMSGTAAAVRYAFGTPIHHYQADGTLHYANVSDPTLPREIEGIVTGIRGLNDFRPRPHARPRFTSSLSGNHYLAPGDFATIYGLKSLYSSGIDGTGQSIVVVGQTDIQLSDIEAFETASGLPIKDPTVILVPGSVDPGVSSGDLVETDLDLEWAGAIARGATIIFVNSTDVINISLPYAIDNNLAPVR